MIKGQIIGGDYSTILMRVKHGVHVELGELFVAEHDEQTFLFQVFDLSYGSQISSQNLELVAGLNLEQGDFRLLDASLRTYTIASLKPLFVLGDGARSCKHLPAFFSSVRSVTKQDLSFISSPQRPLYLGELRSGSSVLDFPISLHGTDVLNHHMLVAASTGKGKSNFMSCLLWELCTQGYAGMLVLDPHDEYYGRVGLGLKDHAERNRVVYYTPSEPPSGARSLVINVRYLRPEHFSGAISFSDAQWQCVYSYFKVYGKEWVDAVLRELSLGEMRYKEETLAVVKRRLLWVLGLELEEGTLRGNGIFSLSKGEETVRDICDALEQAKTVVVDTSHFGGALEVLVGSLLASELYSRYRRYKRQGILQAKPGISIVLEEAPRVLGKKVLEQGTNIFETLAREGRKFRVGLIALTQIPSEIPRTILANMNTKVILGLEMGSERNAVIESAAQDLSRDARSLASLDRGEAIVTSTFTRFALPLKIPLFREFVKRSSLPTPRSFSGVGL